MAELVPETSSLNQASVLDSSAIEAQLNPFLLHHSNTPATILVTNVLNGASNYNSWSKAMLLALSGKNKLGFINGTIKKPEGSLLPAWQCNNDIVISWIINAVSKNIAAIIPRYSTAKDAWDLLKERYHQTNGPLIYQLRKQLITASQGAMTIEAYYTKLATIWEDLTDYRPVDTCSCGGTKAIDEFLQSEFVTIFLMGLNDSFAAIRAQILLMNPLPLINKVFSLIIQEEHNRATGMNTLATESIALLATDNPKRVAPAERYRRKEGQRPMCLHCGYKGHTIDRCYKLHGFPPGYKTNNSRLSNEKASSVPVSTSSSTKGTQSAFFASLNTDQCSQLMNLLQTHLTTDTSEGNRGTEMTNVAGMCFPPLSKSIYECFWVVDSGASSHICFNKALFANMRKVHNISVILPTKQRYMVEYVGDVWLTSDVLINEVLYMPQFSYNLLSISSLLKDKKYSINFTENSCSIQDKYLSRMIGRIEIHGGLYLFTALGSITSKTVTRPMDHDLNLVSSTRVCRSSTIWHQRLGHPSPKRLNMLKNTLLFHESLTDHVCHICPLAKQRRLTFPFNNHVCDHVFDLIHCDIWGPFKTPTHAGYSYFLTLVDDHSRYTWVFLMKSKSDVLSIIPRFFKLVETQFSKKIKSFRSDNAPELRFEEFFASVGTIHQYSCVATPQQNSVVERKHQHLLNVARALLFQSRVPITFWGGCVLTAAFLINRTPMPLLDNQSPYTVLFENKVDYHVLRVFGCLAYASTLSAHRNKFDPRA